MLKKNVRWARHINPVILTLSFVLEQPLIPIYTTYYLCFSIGANFAYSFMVPWLICETFFGMLLSWVLIFTSMTLAVHRNLDASCDIPITLGFWGVSFIMQFYCTKDFAFSYKVSVSQKLLLRRQRDEF